jgi:hypothetical protein
MSRAILITIIVLVAFCALALGYALFSGLFNLFTTMADVISEGTDSPPVHLRTPGVLVGEAFLLKEKFLEEKSLSEVTDIRIGELDPAPGEEIGIVSPRGVVFTDMQGDTKNEVRIQYTGVHVDFVDVEGDGIIEYFERGSAMLSPRLFDHSGKNIWKYGGFFSMADDMAAGDVDGDGMAEFAVGYGGGGGIHLLNSDGKKEWQQPDGNVWHVAVADTDGDNKAEIIHSNAGGDLTVRNALGNIVVNAEPESYFSHFSISMWPEEPGVTYAIIVDSNILYAFNYDGTTAKKIDAPNCGYCCDLPHTAVAKLDAEQPEYLAMLVELRHWERSVFTVFTSEGEIVYQEILPEYGAAIAAAPLGDDDMDSILVGGRGRVWRYDLADVELVVEESEEVALEPVE